MWRMSYFLNALLPRSEWVLAAIGNEAKDFRTYSHRERDMAEAFLDIYEAREIRVLAGIPRTFIVTAPTIDRVESVCAVGIRVDLSQKAAIRSLANAPGIAFDHRGWYRGKWQPHFIAAWRFERPVAPKEAERVEKFLAERFKGERLNFFIPVPKDQQPQDFVPRFIDPKTVESAFKESAVFDPEDEEFVRGDLAKVKKPPALKRGWIPAEAFTLYLGRPKRGKSLAVAKTAAYITAGGVWFDGEPVGPESRGSAIIIEEEDSRDETLARCKAAGCDMAKVHVRVRVPDISNAAQLKKLTDFAESLGDCRMISFSPLQSAIPSKDYNEAIIREKFRPILRWARGRNIALIGVVHLSKDGSQVAGSDVIVRACRASLAFDDHPNDKREDEFSRQRVMRIMHSNVGKMGTMYSYDTEGVTVHIGGEDIPTARIVFKSLETATEAGIAGPVDVPIMDRIEPPIGPTKRLTDTQRRYVKWLAKTIPPLTEGGIPMELSTVRRLAKENELGSVENLNEAVRLLDITYRKRDGARANESGLLVPPSEFPADIQAVLR